MDAQPLIRFVDALSDMVHVAADTQPPRRRRFRQRSSSCSSGFPMVRRDSPEERDCNVPRAAAAECARFRSRFTYYNIIALQLNLVGNTRREELTW